MSPDITALPGQIQWFAPFLPKHLAGPCPHGCDHRRKDVAAWGPTEELYELLECWNCGCRAWRPWEPALLKGETKLVYRLTLEDGLRR